MKTADLIVIGAGPAGMAAASTAADAGLSVLLLDEQRRAGGQIYRDVKRAATMRGHILGQEFTEGLPLAEGIEKQGITQVFGATVWNVEPTGKVACSVNGQGMVAQGLRVLLATGALERPMPIPGWTLPGVMTAGAAQILLKQSGLVPKRAVLAGSGPLLYLIAAQMVRAGVPPLALVETQVRGDFIAALRHSVGALRGWRYLLKGLKMLREIEKAGVPRYRGTTGLAVEGEGQAEALTFTASGQSHRIACDTVLLHHGVVPNTQAARSLGVDHVWSDRQACFVPRLDQWGGTGHDRILIAGDGAGIGGARVAEIAGRLAALRVATDLGRMTGQERDALAAPLFRQRNRELAVRPFLDMAYPPYTGALSPDDGTIICRCEEVTAGDIRRFARLGCKGPNQAKAFGRAGMGPCQGRYCGLAVSSLLAQENDATHDETGYFRIRPPLKPVTLGELAATDDSTDRAE
ncbi:NAD(P)/FAD-dependent oxidoreductase [uncultured Roseovarius sp.]|uniref:FAD/NAD(P)-dependent oxidoreductase n=1 Tax=uncultured Roseovarius sp. TaxID=293344 RepID=UPI0025945FDE|nr:NAD(P)/FAD-dependent oxidoreductase [uncultured Roseovarius sp.]